MKIVQKSLGLAVLAALLGGCAGVPTPMGSRSTGPVPSGPARAIQAESCGFQLFGFIPIAINGRQQRAYESLEAAAAGDFITDVEIQDSWGYRFVGNTYCTALRAKAIQTKPKG